MTSRKAQEAAPAKAARETIPAAEVSQEIEEAAESRYTKSRVSVDDVFAMLDAEEKWVGRKMPARFSTDGKKRTPCFVMFRNGVKFTLFAADGHEFPEGLVEGARGTLEFEVREADKPEVTKSESGATFVTLFGRVVSFG